MPKTEIPSATTESDTDRGTRACCTACPHDRDAHDPIGARFCAATTAGALRRGCVCLAGARASAPHTR